MIPSSQNLKRSDVKSFTQGHLTHGRVSFLILDSAPLKSTSLNLTHTTDPSFSLT